MIEDEPEPVRRGRVAMGHPVADSAVPAAEWHLVMQCAGPCQRQRRLVALEIADEAEQVLAKVHFHDVLGPLE